MDWGEGGERDASIIPAKTVTRRASRPDPSPAVDPECLHDVILLNIYDAGETCSGWVGRWWGEGIVAAVAE